MLLTYENRSSIMNNTMREITVDEFAEAEPYEQGYAVYMLGSREDQPNVPNNTCPYDPESVEAECWNAGQKAAVIDAQDSEE